MVFNSIEFLVFIALFFPLYYLLKGNARLWLSLGASYLFYGWWDWRFLLLIMASTVLDFALGLWIEKSPTQEKRKQLLLVSMVVNLGFLAFFKYFNFFADSFAEMCASFGYDPGWNTLNIILPVGISFYTFQSMSYTIDVYKKEIEAEPNFLRFATFVAFFPQLVAGPIVRASDFLPQFQKDHPFDREKTISGLTQMLWGFFKKVAIADSLAPFVDQCFAAPDTFSSMHLLIGVIFYSFQIYCDFSGYSDIAIGLARTLGFEFPVNFKTPYFSQNFSEFWARWHISLSSWLRDYLYIPLGGNRGSQLFTFRNNMITMLLGGLWHGANWTFVFWGFLHGSYLILQRILSMPWNKILKLLRVPNWLSLGFHVLLVYSLTNLAWIYFRSPNFATASKVIGNIASLEGFNFGSVINKFTVIKGALLIFMLLGIELSNFRMHFREMSLQSPYFRVASFAILLWLIAFFGTFGSNSFIYFQF